MTYKTELEPEKETAPKVKRVIIEYDDFLIEIHEFGDYERHIEMLRLIKRLASTMESEQS